MRPQTVLMEHHPAPVPVLHEKAAKEGIAVENQNPAPASTNVTARSQNPVSAAAVKSNATATASHTRPSPAPASASPSASGFSPVNTTPSGIDRNRFGRGGRPGGDTLDKLRALPEVRPLPWYDGRELPDDRATNSSRVQTRGACLLVTRGTVNNPPCAHCSGHNGRFSLCVSHEDWYNGACATCVLGTRGNLCTYRNKDTLRVKRERDGKSNENEAEALHSVPRKEKSPSQTESLVESPASASHVPIDPDFSSKKRKRKETQEPVETLQDTHVWKPYVSPYASSAPANRTETSLPNTPTAHSPPTGLPPGGPPLMNYVYKKDALVGEPPLNDFTRYRPIAAAKAPPLPQHTMSLPPNSGQHGYLRHTELARPLSSKGREPTDSLSPSTQLFQSQPYAPQERLVDRPQDPPGASSGLINSPITRPIDNLPRQKQLDIYNIINGLQSGITSCQQQAYGMQRQLNMLRTTLGISVDDDSTEDKSNGG